MKAYLLIAVMLVLSSCSSTSETDYDNNAMFSSQQSAPVHRTNSQKGNFFNKECKKSGANEKSGSEYECSYK